MDQEQAEREEGISQSGRLSLFSTVVPVLSTESSKEQAMAENREQNESQQAPREQSAQQAPRGQSGQPASETSQQAPEESAQQAPMQQSEQREHIEWADKQEHTVEQHIVVDRTEWGIDSVAVE